ncbi:MAG TPA: DUF1127 domain-containing protein [Stellaceae bacterium]|nr:DUF1127 domain-containing protein [Stellaceae bacterium]
MSTLEQRLRWRRQPYESGFSRLRILAAAVQYLAAEWHRRARSRAELAQMSDHDLRDIGITRAEAAYESAKPFWRA